MIKIISYIALTSILVVITCSSYFSCMDNVRDDKLNAIQIGNNIQNYKYEKCLVEATKDYEKWVVFYDYENHYITTKHDTIVAIWSR